MRKPAKTPARDLVDAATSLVPEAQRGPFPLISGITLKTNRKAVPIAAGLGESGKISLSSQRAVQSGRKERGYHQRQNLHTFYTCSTGGNGSFDAPYTALFSVTQTAKQNRFGVQEVGSEPGASLAPKFQMNVSAWITVRQRRKRRN